MNKEEQLLVYLKGFCLGRARRIGSKELQRALNLSSSDLRKYVSRLRRKKEPIASDQNGYYYAQTSGEVYSTIRYLKKIRAGLDAVILGLEESLDDFSSGRRVRIARSFIPWVGGKSKLLWLIRKLAPPWYPRFIDVFGGSGTVTLSRPLKKGCMEVYNDYNSNLTNLFCCVKDRTLALLKELGFLPLNARDDFDVLLKFFSKDEFTDDYLKEELELTQVYLRPLERESIQKLLLERSPRGDIRRAADYFKLIRYSFSGGGKAFAGKPCDIRRFFYLIWECSRRLANVIIENKDFESLIQQYDRENAFFYCDPPYFQAEDCYQVEFPKEDHYRLHDVLLKCKGHVMVSYNYCSFILDLYKEFYIFYTTRPNSMSQTADSLYEELIITNYDPRKWTHAGQQFTLFPFGDEEEDERNYQLIHEPDVA